MEVQEFMTNFQTKPADVLQDKISESGESGSRTVRLSFEFAYGGMLEKVAELDTGAVTLYSVDFNPDESEGEKALEKFRMSPEQMDTLAASWIQFRSDAQTKVELYEAKLAQKRTELIARATRLGATVIRMDEGNEYYGPEYKIEWDAAHKHRDIYRSNQGLSFADVKQRLDLIEEEMKGATDA